MKSTSLERMKTSILLLLALGFGLASVYAGIDSAKKSPDFFITLDQDSLRVKDAKTGETVYTECWDTERGITRALIYYNDNE